MIIKDLKDECDYLYETLNEASNTLDLIIKLFDEFLYKKDSKIRKLIEYNLFYLDSINFSIKESLNLFSNINFKIEDFYPNNNLESSHNNEEEISWVDLNYKIPSDIYNSKKKNNTNLKIIIDNSDNNR